MSKDVEKGIGNLLGYEAPETKRVRDLYYLDKVKRIIESPLEPKHLGETLARTTPSLNLTRTPKETKEATECQSEKEYEKHLINTPTKTQHEKAFNMGDTILKTSAAKKNKMVNEWMKGGGRDPKGRSFDQEIKLGKDTWLKNQKTVNQLKALKEWAQPTPVGLGDGDQYKSDIRTPVQKKRDSFNAKVESNKARLETNKAKVDPTKGAHYIPWQERMAQEEAEALNNIKRTTWDQGGRVKPEPKYVTAQDVKNVYDKK